VSNMPEVIGIAIIGAAAFIDGVCKLVEFLSK
jgi:hypothetical protein